MDKISRRQENCQHDASSSKGSVESSFEGEMSKSSRAARVLATPEDP